MIAFWIAAALMSAAAAALMIHRAARAAARAALQTEDPSLIVYRRQLGEVDDLAGRGLLTAEEYRSTRTEAARRLLSAAQAVPAAVPASPRRGRAMAVTLAVLAPLVAVGLYLLIGSPNLPDQPFQLRLSAWRKQDPAQLDPERMAAVLREIVRERPGDVEALNYLARAQAAAGDFFSAERTLQGALKRAPNRADLWTLEGQFIASEQPADALPEDARLAFAKALALDPKAPAPRYFLARDKIAAGDVDGGLADWRALRADLAPNDGRAQQLDSDMAVVERTRALPAAQTGPAGAEGGGGGPGGDQKAFIQSMVARLAARLQTHPDDPAGWARLVKSYGVLGDVAARDAALAKARGLFKSRPGDLALIEQAAQ